MTEPCTGRIWVDWNQDNDFSDAGELAYNPLVTSFGGYTGTITVPATAVTGTTRMRVGSNSAATSPIPPPADACTTVTYGEFEDYGLAISVTPAICMAPASPGATAITSTSATLDWGQAGTPAQWQIKYGSTGFNVSTGGTSVYTTVKPYTLNPPLSPATAYDYYVRAICAPGDTSAWSVVSSFTTANCSPSDITSLSDGDRCGQGTVVLTAAAVAGATIKWYTAAAGGTAVATGNSFTTPSLTASTTYYITASFGTCESDPREAVMAYVYDMPALHLGNDTSICSGDQIVLDAGNPGAEYFWSTGATTQTIQAGTAGTYSVTTTTPEGCAQTEDIQVSVLGAPRVDGLSYITLFQEQAGKVRFTAQNPVHVESYEWNFGDGTAISTAVSPEHVYAAKGNYTATLKVSNKCDADTKSVAVTITGGTGIALPDYQAAAVKLYPNPAHDLLRISSEAPDVQLKHVTVFNLLGGIIYDRIADNREQHSLPVSGWAPGLYSIRILTDKGSVIRKFEVL
ncbi:Ig-like domain-containing protein [Taibaiella koreensis]|uniref:Ig-like domain-containing protein n=1 Tax=Taibaiella koreensis TaxID=1268548 RepID=UPI0013C35F1A|nr:GEVED domain-containing protein [Taibaiella koreensis]